jgi:tetratricopeptide (TPR) repeat protein
MRNFFVILLSFILFNYSLSSQNQMIDSLLKENESLRSLETGFSRDTTLINVLNLLSREFINIGNYTRADSIAREALIFEEKQLEFHKGTKGDIFKSGKAKSLSNIGIVYSIQGDPAKALEHFYIALDIAKELGDKNAISKSLGYIGNVFKDQGNFSKSLEFYFQALKLSEELKNDRNAAILLANIGNVYKAQMDYPKSLEYYFKALKLAEQMKDDRGIAVDLSNIGIVYKNQGEYNKALEYYFKALEMAEKLQHKLLIANTVGNIGSVYSVQKEFPKALEYLNKALLLAEKLGDKSGKARLLGNIGTIYLDQKKLKEAETYLQQSLPLSKEVGDKNMIKDQHYSLSRLYQYQNKWELSLKEFKSYVAMRDSLFNEENTKRALRSELNFEFEKKLTADSVKNAGEQKIKDSAIQAQQAQLKQEKTQRYSLYGGLLLVLVFFGFLFNRFQITSRQKKMIEDQKMLVEEKNKEVMDSINYARRIQDALLKEDELNKSYLPEHFTLFKAKDIVSGDFYWNLEKHGFWYLCVADCTGHGVPGAFMSMLGIAYLNEINATEKVLSPAEILDALREKIVKELKQKGESGESKDGMDISLIRYDLKEKELQWAGANNPLWIVKKNNNAYELSEIKPDKQPIGYTINPQPFKNHIVPNTNESIIYLFTDGYADQFGGPKGKKFKYKQLQNKILSICDQPLTVQKDLLDKTFNEWKGPLEQLDDVAITGIRI